MAGESPWDATGSPGSPTPARRGSRLALFPLPMPLFPGTPLPLHVFEPRYRRLVADVEAAPPIHRHFGVVAITRPAGMTPHATTADLRPIGTTARVLDVEELEDGRFDLSTIGSRRFRLRRLIPDSGSPYLVGEVEWIDHPLHPPAPGDAPAAVADLAETAGDAFDHYLAAVAALQDITLDDLERPSSGEALSWTIATVALLTGDERHELLACATTVERLRHELRLLRREIALIRLTRSLPATDGMLAVDHSAS